MTIMNDRRQPTNASLRWVWMALFVLLLAAAWAEPLLAHHAYPRQIDIGGHDLGLAQGWSAKEGSNTLPGPHGPISATYRWSGASSELVFAPATPAQSYAITMRLLSGRPGNHLVAHVMLSS